jgi:hypothetical protein
MNLNQIRDVSHKENKSNVSNNHLIHFTPSFDNLFNIIKTGFRAKLNTELQNYQADYVDSEVMRGLFQIDPIVPQKHEVFLVCFSDIPKQGIKNHQKLYGYYGIELTKEWAIANYISPVLYYPENTMTHLIFNNIYKAIDELYENIQDFNSSPELNIYYRLSQFRYYLKQYQDPETKQKYYDEREWRYIPQTRFDKNDPSTYLKFKATDIKSIYITKITQRDILMKYFEQNGIIIDKKKFILSKKAHC